MAIKKFNTKKKCLAWLKQQNAQSKWLGELKEGYLGIAIEKK